MMLDSGDTILVSHRRLFDGDEPRFFIGRTIACEGPLFKAEGYSFVRDLATGHIVKKPEKRIKLMSIASPGQMVYQLPNDIDMDSIDVVSRNADAMLVAGPRIIMNLSEHTRGGHFPTPSNHSFFV